MSARDVPTDGPLGRFAADLIADEFPDLPADRLDETVAFCCRRCSALPDPLRLGVATTTGAVTLASRVAGPERVRRIVRARGVPLASELVRLIRSLAVTFIWERWPGTTASGAPGRIDEPVESAT